MPERGAAAGTTTATNTNMPSEDRTLLLDDVLERFMPDKKERDLIRTRVLGVNKRVFPEQTIGALKVIPERPRFSERMGQSLMGGGSSNQHKHD